MVPDSDWTNFRHFANAFFDPQADRKQARERRTENAHPSSIFLAVEVDQTTLTKAYLIPVIAEQTGQTRLDVLASTMTHFPLPLPAWVPLSRHLQQHVSSNDALSIVGVAVDCIVPAHSRIKIYIRSPSTSFSSVRSMLTLNGHTTTWSEDALVRLYRLWTAVLCLPQDHPIDQNLDYTRHETAGILYHYDIQPYNDIPECKVYIPVKHYGKND